MSTLNTREDLSISTKGMRKIESPVGGAEFDRLTKYYEDAGQLHWCFGRGVETQAAYFIQGEDREMAVVIEPDDKSELSQLLMQHLDTNIKSKVTKCRVPTHSAHYYEHEELGLALFLTQFHPSAWKRGTAAIKLFHTPFHMIVYAH